MIDFPATALPVISSRSNFPNVTYDESKVAAVNLLLMFVQRIQETQDAIRKNTDLIPSLVHKVDRTPQKTVAMISGATRKRMRATGAVVEDDFKASQQYRNINWQGRSYRLNPNAARIVEALHDAHRTIGLPSLHQEEIFSRAFGSDRRKWPSRHPRVQNFFRTGDGGRLWRDGLFGHDQKGNFWLNLASVRRTEYVR